MNSAALTDDDRRDLVAYLDGELPPDEAARVEARMLADHAFREEMQALQGTFDLLEDLPVSTVSPDFARTTVEVAALDLRRRPFFGSLTGRRLLALGLVLVGAVATATLGFAWQRNRQLLPEREAIREFPIAENFDVYSRAHDVEFLRLLKANGLFDEGDGATGALNETAISANEAGPDLAPVGSLTPQQVQARIDALSSADREVLASRMSRYDALPPEQRKSLREMHDDLLADPNGEELLRVARRFSAWESTVPGENKIELQALASDPEARLEKVRELMKSEEAREFLRLVSVDVKQEDHKAIVAWLENYVETNQPRFREKISPEGWSRLQELPESERWLRILAAYRWNPQGGEPLPMPRPTDAELDQLRQSLTGDARRAFEQAGDPERKLRLLDQWMFAAVWARRFEVDKEKLEAFHRDRLTPAVRAELDKLPSDELHRRLQFIYRWYDGRLEEGETLDVDDLRRFLGERPSFGPPMRRDGPGSDRRGPGRGPGFPPGIPSELRGEGEENGSPDASPPPAPDASSTSDLGTDEASSG